MTGLGVEGAAFAARLGLHRLLDFKGGRTGFLDDGQRAVAVRAEGFHRVRIKSAAVAAAGQWKRGDDFSVVGAHDDARGRLPAHRKQDVVLRINPQSRRGAGVALQRVGPRQFERVCVYHTDGGLVFEADINVAVQIADGLFRRAADVNGTHHRAVLGVNHRNLRGLMTEDVNLLGGRLKQDAVRAGGHVNFLDGLHGLGVKHGDGPAAAESVLGLGVHHRAVAARAGDRAEALVSVEIENHDLVAARNINPAVGAVRNHIINPARPVGLGYIENLIRLRSRSGLGWNAGCRQHSSNHDEAARKEIVEFHKHIIPAIPTKKQDETDDNLVIHSRDSRLTNSRLTNSRLGYSKTVTNLRHAVALFIAHFNYCWIHSAHKKTPAQAAMLTKDAWTVEKLIEECGNY
jgi:hypothetical protein